MVFAGVEECLHGEAWIQVVQNCRFVAEIVSFEGTTTINPLLLLTHYKNTFEWTIGSVKHVDLPRRGSSGPRELFWVRSSDREPRSNAYIGLALQ